MQWEDVIGREALKTRLQNTIKNNRVAHAQLFISPKGQGGMDLALAYANALLNQEKSPNVNLEKLLKHPDLHFCFPTTTMTSPKIEKPTSKQFLSKWYSYLPTHLFGGSLDWMQYLEVEKKQGLIPAREIQEIVHDLSLNSFSGGYKVLLMWLPETMHQSASNKLLKILEEPPKNTVFILLTHAAEALLPTILSRCQQTKLPELTTTEVANYLQKQYQLDDATTQTVIEQSGGNLNWAIALLQEDGEIFVEYFINWVRMAFMARTRVGVLKDIVSWTLEISKWSRERQKQFLEFCLEVFRLALLENYDVTALSRMPFGKTSFNWAVFTKYINGANIPEIIYEINTASRDIDHNGNAKVILLDATIKMTRHLHKKPS